jgi:hypothetical protein
MANPTSNFGWQMPTPTDLVTDLPADFEVFGQAVDTSMADLKGGTSGQVLSKNSNTDMDFVWVTSDDANAIQNTIVDAKGDLIGATASDTPARLAVGANGTMLVANSAESTGLKWTTATDQFPWQTWTPTYTRLTIGNGTVTARYQQIGKTINFVWSLTWGSTTSVTNYPIVSAPVSGFITGTQYGIGTLYLQDISGLSYQGIVQLTTGTGLYLSLARTDGGFLYEWPLDNTTPVTWTTGDKWTISGSYEAA